MKIVDQARLGFREGNSDKVYEVDLVEVAPNQYVVNFRYGRRGSALRDGTKTPLPITLDKARTVFGSIVAEKLKGGYLASTDPVEARAPRVPVAVDRVQALLAELALGHRARTPLPVLVRKVGERALSEAEPLLLELLRSGSATESNPDALRHGLIAALARCGSARALPALTAIADDAKAKRHLREVALLALTMIDGAAARQRARAAVPAGLRPEAGSDAAALLRAAEELLARSPGQAHAALFALYVSAKVTASDDDPDSERLARRVVLGAVRVARLRDEELGLLRALTWAAELRRDAELFALLTRRFDGQGPHMDTVRYFRRRAARTLQRLGRLGSPDYVPLATALLLQYRDTDAEPVRESEHGSWDAFAPYSALNFVLYGNSARYERAGHRRATWRCKNRYSPGDLAPTEREESFPARWDAAPDALWQLGVSSAAGIVIHFATRALRAQPEYLTQLSDATLAAALSEAQRPMRRLAFEVVRARTPNVLLARAALRAELAEADHWVLEWVKREPNRLTSETELLVALVTARSVLVRDALPALLGERSLSTDVARRVVEQTVALLMQLSERPEDSELSTSAGNFLLAYAGAALDGLSMVVARDLLAHPCSGTARLGAELVFRRAATTELEEGLLDLLLSSPHAAVRSVGARVIASTPPAVIKNEPALLVHFSLSANAELREGLRGLLAEVARLFPEVGREVAGQLVDALLTRQAEGVPAHVVSLLRHELRECLPQREPARVLALINALSPHAREAGGLLLTRLGPDELELDAIVRLASHEILAIRRGAWALARAAKERFRIAPVALARLCDARWEDSRAFAFDFVRSFEPAVLVPDAVIAICDSVEPAVQRFGQALLLEHWREEHAERYLLRLSEHPSSNVQLLVSGLLERHARGNLALLEQLLPCLTVILSQVNRGGVAKLRVLDFLRTESVASAEAAALVAPLLERQSLTRAVSHKAPLIATLVDLHARYPEVGVPIVSPVVPVRTRSNRGV